MLCVILTSLMRCSVYDGDRPAAVGWNQSLSRPNFVAWFLTICCCFRVQFPPGRKRMADSALSTANTSVESLDTFDTPTTTPVEQVVDPLWPHFVDTAASSHSTILADLRSAVLPLEQTDKLGALPIGIHGTASVPEEITLARLASSSSSSLPMTSSSPSSISDLSPSFLLVASLRSQITDLTSQVTSLNSKLVKGYTRIGDLEDELHETVQEGGRLKGKLGELEKDKNVLESEIEGGGWVEKVSFNSHFSSLLRHGVCLRQEKLVV